MFAQANNHQKVVAKAFNKKGVGAKMEKPTTDVVAPKPDPNRSECCLNFDNWTGYWCDIWVDGVYRGSIAPYGEDYVCVAGGWTSYYVSTSGRTYEWEWEDDANCRGWWDLTLE